MEVGGCITKVKVGKMVNMLCVKKIEGKIGQQIGVIRINVFLQRELAEIVYDPDLTSVQKLCQVIEEIGYEANPSTDEGEGEDTDFEDKEILQTVINVEGMVCMSCVESIEGVVGDLAGVADIKVSLTGKNAIVRYYANRETVDTLVKAISDMGFDATPVNQSREEDREKKATISITGMTCNSCVHSIEKMISGVNGVISINVSLENETAIILYQPKVITIEEICNEIDDMGFEAKISHSSKYIYIFLIYVLHSKPFIHLVT